MTINGLAALLFAGREVGQHLGPTQPVHGARFEPQSLFNVRGWYTAITHCHGVKSSAHVEESPARGIGAPHVLEVFVGSLLKGPPSLEDGECGVAAGRREDWRGRRLWCACRGLRRGGGRGREGWVGLDDAHLMEALREATRRKVGVHAIGAEGYDGRRVSFWLLCLATSLPPQAGHQG